MTAAFLLLASLGGAAAAINFNEIIKDPSTKGWGVGGAVAAGKSIAIAKAFAGVVNSAARSNVSASFRNDEISPGYQGLSTLGRE